MGWVTGVFVSAGFVVEDFLFNGGVGVVVEDFLWTAGEVTDFLWTAGDATEDFL